jgi:hypothetical protein
MCPSQSAPCWRSTPSPNPLHSLELAEHHAKCQHPGCQHEEHRLQARPQPIEEPAPKHAYPIIHHQAHTQHTRPHHRRQPKQRRHGIIQSNPLILQEDLGECPPQSTGGGGREDEEEPPESEGGLGGDHQEHAPEDEGDDGDEAEGEGFELESEGEDEDENEGGGFDHGWEGECGVC